MPVSGRGKMFGSASMLFDPSEGVTIRTPLNRGAGWWVGAPGAHYDPVSNTFYLVYRHRQPRELGRGVECRIAASENGISFQDIWALPKTSFDALSIEKSSLVFCNRDSVWRLYISYVSPEDNRWRIGMMEASEPDQFAASNLQVIMTAESTGTEGVKDPNVFMIGPMYYMVVSYATGPGEASEADRQSMHATGDIYNTGLTLSRSAAAVSFDGKRFRWLGDISPSAGNDTILEAGHGRASIDIDRNPIVAWDSYCKRVGTVLPMDSGGYIALYDGSSSVSENYEEKCGVAITFDLKNYLSITADGPALTSREGSGSLRYVDVLTVGHELFYYYEIARHDGSHDLCVSVTERM